MTRMHTENQGYAHFEKQWGYDRSVLSKTFDAVLTWLLATHGSRLRGIESMDLERCNRAFLQSLERRGISGDDVPAELLNVAGYWDGSRWHVRRYFKLSFFEILLIFQFL